jgi:LmbE family N-acetylglucosaminyl deacetylase
MKTLVVAPHPDDELLGCGGTLLRRKAEGNTLAWMIVTGISVENGWPQQSVHRRSTEIDQVAESVGFSAVYTLGLPTTQLDRIPIKDLISQFSAIFMEFQPEEVFLPHRSDVHSDHRVVFDAAAACVKWFRFPFVRRVLAYETPSETEFSLDADASFQPNVFIDISDYLNRKLELLAIYQSELGDFPFPRSVEAIRSLAAWRGANSGVAVAEAFQLLRERQ